MSTTSESGTPRTTKTRPLDSTGTNTATRFRASVRAHGLDWITAALAATAVALFILAIARAAGAAQGTQEFYSAAHDAERATRVASAQSDFDRRSRKVVADVDYYIDSLERVFARDLGALERELDEVSADYDRDGDARNFDRRVKALQVRMEQLSKRVGQMASAMSLPRSARAY